MVTPWSSFDVQLEANKNIENISTALLKKLIANDPSGLFEHQESKPELEGVPPLEPPPPDKQTNYYF
jgi:hypothetical protein